LKQRNSEVQAHSWPVVIQSLYVMEANCYFPFDLKLVKYLENAQFDQLIPSKT